MNRSKRFTLIGVVLFLILAGVMAALQFVDTSDSSKETTEAPLVLDDPDGDAGPELVSVEANAETVAAYGKFELSLEMKADYSNPYDPGQIDVNAVFVSPGGVQWNINGFYNGVAWRLRFAPNEAGKWRYKVAVTDKTGTTVSGEASFVTEQGDSKGWIKVSDVNKRYFEYDDGSSFYGVGVAYPWGVTEDGLTKIADNGGNLVTYWNGNYDNAGIGGGKQQLESYASGIGNYDVLKGFRMDELVEWFEARDLHMNFVIWPHDSLADKIPNWPATWTQSAYSTLGPAEDFYGDEEMWKYQEKLYRYIIARWGHSRSIGIWNLITEINGTDGWAFGREEEANAWVTKAHQYFKANDPYDHPTMGSMAGGGEDVWDHGYRTLDIADRENYYDLHFSAYANDVQSRRSKYEKPVMTGETGNVTDPIIHHHSMWASLANGSASSPIWWEIGTYNEEMYKQMNVFSDFAGKIDFLEARKPVTLATSEASKQFDSETPLEDGADAADWNMPDWPEANKDGAGSLFKPEAVDGAIQASMLFGTGGYAQGFLQQIGGKSDWQGYGELLVDIYAEFEGVEPLKARPVLMPGGNWTEGDDSSDASLVTGEWVTLRVPLKDIPAGYWRDGKQISAEELANISGWGVKVYALSTDKAAKPSIIKLRNPRLSSAEPPSVTVKESEGWAMLGEKLSYGWLVTEHGVIGGKQAEVTGLGDGEAALTWYDTWTGEKVESVKVNPENGIVKLTVPRHDRTDIAFTIER